jgi:hypothetical protein
VEPLSILALFNEKTLDYLVDNQAFVAKKEAPLYFCPKSRFKPQLAKAKRQIDAK